MSPTYEIKGWCPNSFQPMESGDGLLIRPRVVGPRIDSEQLHAIARIAKTFGNGLIDLSQRAQLQIRGLMPSTLEGALDGLKAAGLLAANPDIARIINILIPPLAGLDKTAVLDANRLLSELSAGLSRDVSLHSLPAKFHFAIQDGGKLPVDCSQADISIHPSFEGRVAIRLAGVEDLAVVVPSEEAIPTVLRIAKAYTELRAEDPFNLRRMGKLTKLLGVNVLIDRAGVSLDEFPSSSFVDKINFLGAQQTGDMIYAGVAAASGRWSAEDMSILVELAVSNGLNEARLTPWRAILFPAPDRRSAIEIESRAKALGLIVDENDPRRSVVACPGAPECLQARGDTRIYLERLAPLARRFTSREGVGLHLSGCSKGCAYNKSTPVTLVLNQGRFDIVYDGGPQDRPVLTNLTLEEVERSMTNKARILTSCPPI